LLYPKGYHPRVTDRSRDFRGSAKHYTRTERPPKYFLIDFGLSRRYDPKDGSPLELPIHGGDKTVPEFQEEGYDKPSDPFCADIYYLGNTIKENFLDVSQSVFGHPGKDEYFYLCVQTDFGFDFMLPLVADMIQDDPSKRPTIDQVAVRFEPIYHSLSTSQLRSRAVQRKENDVLRWWRDSIHFFRRMRFILQQIPPILPPCTSSQTLGTFPLIGDDSFKLKSLSAMAAKSWCPRLNILLMQNYVSPDLGAVFL
jgi:hypothetical protein